MCQEWGLRAIRLLVLPAEWWYLVLQVQPPADSPIDPQPLLTYHSKIMSAATPFGNGWNDAYRRSGIVDALCPEKDCRTTSPS